MRTANGLALLLGVAISASAVFGAHAAVPAEPTPGAAGVPPVVSGPAPNPASLLPEGEGRELLIQRCALCHSIDLAV